MKKTELPLSALTSRDGKGETNANAACAAVRKDVNELLRLQCAQKFNKLKKCNSCDITNPKWPIINSPADASLLNTGYNGSGGILSNGDLDLNWEAGKGTPTSFPTAWVPATVFQSSAWLNSPFGNANWISFYNDGEHSGNEDIYFRYRFYLGLDVDPASFSLDMDFYADNAVEEIYVNGVKQSVYPPIVLPQEPTSPYGHVGFAAGKQVHIALSNDWKPCENEIIVQVKSGAPLIGFLAQNAFRCLPSKMPNLKPVINISWGDSDCDCLETDDYEIMCISVCNPYSDVVFSNLVIGKIQVLDEFGNPVALLPDGTSSVELHPIGPYCFGDIAACTDNGMNCVAREFVLFNRGAKAGKYKIVIEGVCFEICKDYSHNTCFELVLCKN